MEIASRSDKLQVVTDQSGRIVAAVWPGPPTPGAPTSVGLALAAGETVHEVEIPDEIRKSHTVDLETFSVQFDAEGNATLAAKS